MLIGLLLATFVSVGAIAVEPPTTRPATRPGAILLRVVDAQTGEPVAGARLEGYDERTFGEPYFPRGVTDARGEIRVPAITPTQFFRLRVTADDHVRTVVTWYTARPGKPHDRPFRDLPAQYTLELRRGERIGGVVHDESGRPVAGATVKITPYVTNEDFNDGDIESLKLPDSAARPTTRPAEVDPNWPRARDEMWADWTTADEQGRWTWTRTHRADRVSVIAYSDTHATTPSPDATVEALRAGTSVLHVKPGVRVTGVVRDADNDPVPGALIWLESMDVVAQADRPEPGAGVLRPGYSGSTTWGKTDQAGRYLLPAVPPATYSVVAVAPGHGPALSRVRLDPEDAAKQVERNLALLPAATLRARIVNAQGEAVPEAYVGVRNWRGQYDLVSAGARSDADGMIELHNLPAEPLTLEVSAAGYESGMDFEVTPGASTLEEIVLRRPVSAAGTVTDASTGEPVKAFRVVAGYALREMRPVMFEYYNDIPSFADGRYEVTLSGNSGSKRTVVRIEAAGYRPAISAPLVEGENRFDAHLVPAPDIAGVVTGPDGQPVAGAHVMAALPGHQISIGGARPSTVDVPTTTTDATGRFALPPQADAWELLVLHEQGYALIAMKHSWRAESAAADAANGGAEPLALDLKPWARLEGRTDLRAADGTPLKGFGAHIAPFRDPNDPSAMLMWSLGGTVDIKAGRYVIDKLPDFGGRPALLTVSGDGGWFRTAPVTLAASEATALDVLAAPPGSRRVRGHVYPESADTALPEGVQGRVLFYGADFPAPLEAPGEPDDAVAMARPTHATDLRPDGTFEIAGLPPGRYSVQAIFWAGAQIGYGGTGVVTVPEGDADQIADVGGIAFARTPDRPEQLLPPAVLAHRYRDGAAITRESLTDGWTLLMFYASCDATTAARLDQLEELTRRLGSHAQRGELRLVAIACDRVSCGLTGIPVRPQLLGPMAEGPWEQGYLDPAQADTLTRVGTRAWPWFVLLGPGGEAHWFGGDIAQAAEEALNSIEPSKQSGGR